MKLLTQKEKVRKVDFDGSTRAATTSKKPEGAPFL